MSELGIGLQAFGRTLVERFGALEIWTAVLLAAALVIERALARRARASWRIALYAPVALRVLVPLDWNLTLAGVPQLDAFVAPLASIRGGAAGESVAWHLPVLHVLVGVGYLAVAAVLAGRAILARVRLGRQLATARVAVDVGVDVPCAILVHEELGPMVVGLLWPRIVLPARLLAPGEKDLLACVLRHETAHLRRRDAWLLAAMQALAIVAWPIVPMWLAVARVRHLIELACDEAALQDADARERLRYGHALLDLASRNLFAVTPLRAGALHFGSTLRARIEALASQRHWPRAVQAVFVFLAPAALFVACGGSVAAPGPSSADSTGDYGYQFETDPAKAASTPAPSASVPPVNAEGRIAPELIQNIVRANFGRFRKCYEGGLANKPKLAGIVSVSFVIGLDGTTSLADGKESTLPDKDVVDCVVRAFGNMAYPRPEGGIVRVVYPIQFGS
jgi:beta-lactamase regulating signal transducer with metallopeptidase domain